MLYHDFYDFDSYTNCYLNAADIYKKLSLKAYEFDCLLNALNGAIISGNKVICDSLNNRCNEFFELDDMQQQTFRGYKLSYALEFGSQQQIKDFIDQKWNYTDFDINGLLNLAYAYTVVHNYDEALNLLSYISNFEHDTLKFRPIQDRNNQ